MFFHRQLKAELSKHYVTMYMWLFIMNADFVCVCVQNPDDRHARVLKRAVGANESEVFL